uniref:Uncharacterized protein n=1 Tax=Tanacetum cinerariifolium TaxID=118510 RepID=A0A6L2MLQ9_TANCI|nr:hypothetical protein [Tanacetum cinerariifolium]
MCASCACFESSPRSIIITLHHLGLQSKVICPSISVLFPLSNRVPPDCQGGNDAEGVDCLPNVVIFEQLTFMRKSKRKDTKLPQTSVPASVANEAVNEEMDDSLEKAVTTAASLNAERDRGNIFKTKSKATPNKPGSQGTSSGGGPKCQEAMRDTIAQTRVLDLETTKTTQALEIDSLKKRVKKLKRRKRSRTHGLNRLYKVGLSTSVESSKDEGLSEEDASKQGMITDIDANEDITLISTNNEQIFDANQDLGVTTAATTPKISFDEATLAQALTELKHKKPKAKAKDKGKAKMIENPVKLKKKDQIQLDEEVALKLQAELQAKFKKEQRLAGERAQQELQANIVLIESWDDVHANIDADYQLAERLQAKEQ